MIVNDILFIHKQDYNDLKWTIMEWDELEYKRWFGNDHICSEDLKRRLFNSYETHIRALKQLRQRYTDKNIQVVIYKYKNP